MSRKSQLPGAADFFAFGASGPGEAEGETQPSREEPPAGPSVATDPDLRPPLIIPDGPTEKVTFYLHPALLKRLELYKAQLLVEHNLKVNRSQILEYLLEEGLRHSESLTEGLLARAK